MRKGRSVMLLGALLVWAGSACATEGLRAGVQAPDFTLKTVKQQVVSLKDAVAQGTVVLHFWKSK